MAIFTILEALSSVVTLSPGRMRMTVKSTSTWPTSTSTSTSNRRVPASKSDPNPIGFSSSSSSCSCTCSSLPLKLPLTVTKCSNCDDNPDLVSNLQLHSSKYKDKDKEKCKCKCKCSRHLNVKSNHNHNSKEIKGWNVKVGLLATLVFLLAVLVYWNSLDGDFVHDDHVSILRNQDVRPSSPWTNLWWNDYWGMPMASPSSHKSYRPITVLTFRANFALANGGSASAFWFHVTNIFIHASASTLLFLLCLQILHMRQVVGFIASTLFAIHPIHTEAVAGITGRADALACLFMLISFHLYAKDITYKRGVTNGISWRVIISGVMGCCAMLAKETGITVIGICILYDLYLHMDLIKRWLFKGFGAGFGCKSEDPRQTQLFRRITFMIAVISLSLGVRLALMGGTLPAFTRQDNPAAYSQSNVTRFLTYTFLPVFHVWLILCPYRLSYDWQMGSIPLVESFWDCRNLSTGIFYTFFFTLLHRAFTKGQGHNINSNSNRNSNGNEKENGNCDGNENENQHDSRCKNGGTIVLVAMLFISLPYLPASNIFFPVGFVAAERILYTPSIGVCILTAHGMELLQKRFRRHRKFLVASLCLMLMSLSWRTWNRNMVWRSRASLFEVVKEVQVEKTTQLKDQDEEEEEDNEDDDEQE